MTINTHRGLYRFTRLSFGVSSAPAIFQKTVDAIFQGLPLVICYVADIPVTGKSDQAHLLNLGEVPSRMQQYGIRLKKEKCRFLK